MELEKSAVGKALKKDAKLVTEYVQNLKQEEIEELELSLKGNG